MVVVRPATQVPGFAACRQFPLFLLLALTGVGTIEISHATTILAGGPAMSHSVSCPACSAAFEVSAEQLGHWVSCPHCAFAFAATSDASAAEAPASLYEFDQSPDRSKTIAVIAIASVAAITVSFVVVLIALGRGSSASTQPDTQAKAKERPAADGRPNPGGELNPWAMAPDDSNAAKGRESASAPPQRAKEAATDPPSGDKSASKNDNPVEAKNDSPPQKRPTPRLDSGPPESLPPETAQESPSKKKAARRPTGRKPDEIQGRATSRVNYHRAAAGLPSVTWDEYSSDACRAHAKYLVQNRIPPTSRPTLLLENPETMGYSKEGEEAAKTAIIVGDVHRTIGAEPRNLIDAWAASFYHRIPLLMPSLKRFGYGYFAGPEYRTNPRGDLWYVLVDVQTGIEDDPKSPKRTEPVVYPGPSQHQVPLKYAMGLYNESPNPIPANGDSQKTGFPITATFFSGASVEQVKATLKDGYLQPVEHWLSTPEEPAHANASQLNSICLIPKAPLKAGASYTVSLSAKVDGKPWQKTWSFSTVAR